MIQRHHRRCRQAPVERDVPVEPEPARSGLNRAAHRVFADDVEAHALAGTRLRTWRNASSSSA